MKKVDIDKVVKELEVATKKAGYEIPIVAAAVKEYNSDFHILVTVILTAQTRDSLVAKMMPSIFGRLRGPKDLVEISEGDLKKLIYPVSFYRNKARHLKQLGRILIDRFEGSVPRSHAELLELPGVGEKTAHIVMHRTSEHKGGIGVDVHVHRISNRL